MSTSTIIRNDPLSTFTLFLNLPTELRIKIWRHALPGPRIIQLHYLKLKDSFSFHGARPPPILHTCRTSREVALPAFELASTRNGQRIYIDFAHDTLYLAAGLEMCMRTAGFFPDFKEKIRSLAVEISSEEDLEKAVGEIWPLGLETATVDIISSDPDNLNEIIFIVGHEEGVFKSQYAERVRFKPGTKDSFVWWKGSIERMRSLKGCTVRFMEARIG